MTPIFQFYNEFDAITISVTAANGETTQDAVGPFTVNKTHDDPAIAPASDDTHDAFPTLAMAMIEFTRLVATELVAIAGEIG